MDAFLAVSDIVPDQIFNQMYFGIKLLKKSESQPCLMFLFYLSEPGINMRCTSSERISQIPHIVKSMDFFFCPGTTCIFLLFFHCQTKMLHCDTRHYLWYGLNWLPRPMKCSWLVSWEHSVCVNSSLCVSGVIYYVKEGWMGWVEEQGGWHWPSFN